MINALSLKKQLYIVVTLTLIGFFVLAILSFFTLRTLDHSSLRVNELNDQILHMTRLELSVLKQDKQSDSGQLKNLLLQAQYLKRFNREDSPKSPYIGEIETALQQWVEIKQQLIQSSEKLGLASDQGLRGALAGQMAELEKSLFTSFRKDYALIKQATSRFIEFPSKEYSQAVILALEAFNKKSEQLGFGTLYQPMLQEIGNLYQQLSQVALEIQYYQAQAGQHYQTLRLSIEEASQQLSILLAEAQEEAHLAGERTQRLILGVCILVAVTVMLMLIRISQRVIGSLKSISSALSNLARGDLTQALTIKPEPHDEIDQAREAVNTLSHSLSTILSQVRASSATLNQGAAGLSDNLAAMVRSNAITNDQAGSVASASEQIRAVIQNMAQGTETTYEKSKQAEQSAIAGDKVITQAISSLTDLAQVFDELSHQITTLEVSSGKIDGVTDMINTLADQTNLLALNAAIEAARAGESGRGFSVVADEVRSLAEKTVQSTQHIRQTVDDIQKSLQLLLQTMDRGQAHVQQGRTLGDQAANAIQEIKNLIHDVAQNNALLINNITEVTEATDSIANNMEQVAHSVSRNKQQSLEIQAYANDTLDKTEQLQIMTERFKCR